MIGGGTRLAQIVRLMPIERLGHYLALNGASASSSPEPAERPAPRPRWHRRPSVRAVAIVGLALLILAFFAGPKLRSWLTTQSPAGLLFASGRIEGRITTLTPKTSAWVVALHADEGQAVEAGQVLATLDDQAQRERLRSAEEQLNALTERLRASNTQLAMTDRQVTLQIEQATAARREADARVQRSRAQALQAQREGERAARLASGQLIAQQEAERARLTAEVADHAVREAEAALETSDKQLSLARLGAQQLDAMRAERDALARQQRQAEAQVAEQRSNVVDFAIRSPITGRVLTRTVERGERVGDGTPLFTLVDLDRLYVKVYVPEPSIGKVALGQEARIYVDAYPGRPFAARVSRVSQEAEFTPKNVETREERVKLVFAVEVALAENPEGVLKPGMPADAVIRWQPDAPWPSR